MAEDSPQLCRVTGRVLKRRAFSSFSVLELVATSINGVRLSGPLTVSAVVDDQRRAGGTGRDSCAHDVYEFVRTSVRLGDVVALEGFFVGSAGLLASAPTMSTAPPSIWKVGFTVSTAAMLEKWDASMHGALYYTKPSQKEASGECPNPDDTVENVPAHQHNALVAKCAFSAASLGNASRLPQLVLQCQDSFVPRLIAYIRERWGHTGVLAVPSSTHFSNTSERHVLLYLGGRYKMLQADSQSAHAPDMSAESAEDVSRVDALQAEVLGDANLNGVIKRSYRFDGSNAGS